MTFKAAMIAIALLAPALSLADDAKPSADMKGMDMSNMKMSDMDMSKTPADQAYMQAMQKMMEATNAMTPTGDANMDFVMMMKPHHQAAVDMAEAYLKYGSDPMLKKMAKDIVASQMKEIEAMNQWEKKHGM